jgi:diguanylate cyclase (GGDEF)-like protein
VSGDRQYLIAWTAIMSAYLDILRESSLFQGIAPDRLAPLVESSPVRHLEPGELLLSPDVPNQFLYFILSGKLHVLVGDGDTVASLPIVPGQCVGEMSIIDGGRVSAPVVVDEAVATMAINVDVFWKLTEAHPLIARNLLGILAQRMRNTTEALTVSLQMQQAYERWAFLDPLTTAYNRRWIEHTLPRYLDRVHNEGSAFTLGIFDIDHFKRFNDTHGHPAGDVALRATVHAVQVRLRPTDRLARMGGEEFCLLLPDTPLAGARIAGERLVRAVAEHPIQGLNGEALPSVTVSLGLATASPDMDSATLIAAADAALYRAKSEGRNRVTG